MAAGLFMAASRAVVKEATVKADINGLLKKAADVSKGADAVQIFDASAVVNRVHVIGAYLNALSAFKNRTNRSKGIAMEMLLFAALTDQIGVAIKRVGARPESRVVVFATGTHAFSKISPMLKNVREFSPDRNHGARALKALGIESVRDAKREVLSAMAVARLGS